MAKQPLLLFPLVASLPIAALLLSSGSAPGPDPGPAASPAAPRPAPPADDGKLRIIAFGAHPDDCELKASGVAAKWAALGHHVKFVSTTNGDIGHHEIAGGPLARRRKAEVEDCARILGIVTEVLDIHDGEIMPTLENRRKIVKLIREWKADVVLGPRPNDYHPDHRYTGILLQDAAFMVIVPYFCPDVPALRKNPIFLYYSDGFKKPNPFEPDVVVSIDDVAAKKFDSIAALESQFCEWNPWLFGYLDKVPKGKAERRLYLEKQFTDRYAPLTEKLRAKVMERYGPEKGARVKLIEAFELCEYGDQPPAERLRELFPF
ncbi:MAG: PIG-L family deacetylase [Planctomycetes bacterium]|nr:PIG-L family deacetylase [Planctomycetota bacterium]